jgi:hypothetical protein
MQMPRNRRLALRLREAGMISQGTDLAVQPLQARAIKTDVTGAVVPRQLKL